MSLWARAAAGLGEAAVDIGNKYLDQQLQLAKAQALADIQRSNALATDDALNSPERRATRRANAVADEEAIGGARNRTELAGKKAQAVDPELLAAETTRARTLAESAAESTRNATKAAGGDKAYMAALKALNAANRGPDTTDYKGRELDNAIKQMAVDNAKHVAEIKKEFATASPERKKQISDELAMLTGKDTDKFMPVPLKDETGNVTGYKIFDTKSGRWVDDAKASDDPIKAAMDARREAEKAKASAAKPAGTPLPQSTAATQDPITTMSDATLRQLAATRGHTNQRAAAAELQRRIASKPAVEEVDTSGIGFGRAN